jgi:hypothetical protein
VTEESTRTSRKYFDIAETMKRVSKLKAIFRERVDSDLTREDFREMIKQVLTVMPQDLPSQKVQDSLAHLFGRPLTIQIANETAWRLSGNTELLRAGEVVTNNVALIKEGWCAVQVLSCRPFLNNPRSKSHRVRGCKYTCLVITGHAAGYVVEKFLTLRHVRFLAGELGFSAPFKNRPFKDERELFGMRFGALFLPSLASEGKPGFSETCTSPAMLSWNKQIIKNRFREGYECPLGESVEKLPCFRCWKGASSCVAAVHSKDFEQDFCEFCNQDSLFDPESVGYALGVCVNCQRHEDTTGIAVKRRVDSVERD